MRTVLTTCFLGWLAWQAAAADVKWTEDYAAALKKAKAEKKLVLLDFTGSDWCPWCIKIDKEVFAKPEFAKYAKDHLVLVKVDFPRRRKLSAEQKAANAKLQQQFKVRGFPTLVVVNADGKEIWRQPGYRPGGPKAFIASLSAAAKKAK